MKLLVAMPRFLWAAFGLLAVVTISAAAQQAASRLGAGTVMSAVTAGVLLAPSTARSARGMVGPMASQRRAIEWLPAAVALTTIVRTGVVLCSLAAALLAPVHAPEGAIERQLSGRQLNARDHAAPQGGGTFWPPAYPPILSATHLVPRLADSATAATAVNRVWFVAAEIGTYLIGRQLYGPETGLAATTLLALWPNLVLGALVTDRPLPRLALLPVAVLQYMRARPNSPFTSLRSTFAIRLATLVQPTLPLLPASPVLAEALHTDGWRPVLARSDYRFRI